MAASPIPINKYTGAAMTCDHELAELFHGHSFMAQYEAITAGVGEETAIGFLTPSLPMRVHLSVDAWASDESVLEIREDPVIVLNSGLARVPFNRDRSGGNSLMRDNDGPANVDSVTTYTVAQAIAGGLAGGVILHHETLAIGGTHPFASMMNGVVKAQRGFLLLPDTEYVAIITAVAVGGATNNIVINWHEHQDAHYKH